MRRNCFHASLPETFRPPRVSCKGCGNRRGAGPRPRPSVSMAPAPRARWAGLWVGCPCPAHAWPLSRGGRWPASGAQADHRPPDKRTCTTPTLTGLPLPGLSPPPDLGPSTPAQSCGRACRCPATQVHSAPNSPRLLPPKDPLPEGRAGAPWAPVEPAMGRGLSGLNSVPQKDAPRPPLDACGHDLI